MLLRCVQWLVADAAEPGEFAKKLPVSAENISELRKVYKFELGNTRTMGYHFGILLQITARCGCYHNVRYRDMCKSLPPPRSKAFLLLYAPESYDGIAISAIRDC